MPSTWKAAAAIAAVVAATGVVVAATVVVVFRRLSRAGISSCHVNASDSRNFGHIPNVVRHTYVHTHSHTHIYIYTRLRLKLICALSRRATRGNFKLSCNHRLMPHSGISLQVCSCCCFSVYPSVCLSLYLSVCLPVCLSLGLPAGSEWLSGQACGSRINVSISRPISSTTSRSVSLINLLVLWPVNLQPAKSGQQQQQQRRADEHLRQSDRDRDKEGEREREGYKPLVVLAFIKSGFS